MLCAVTLGCSPDPLVPATPDDTAVDSSADELQPCSPALSVSPTDAVVLPYSLVPLQGQGGTGAYTFSLAGDDGGARLNAHTGALVVGELAPASLTVTLTDAGCSGQATATVRVVTPLESLPVTALVAPSTPVDFEVRGGSGDTSCALDQNESGATLDGACRYAAGPGVGVDQVVFTDLRTGFATSSTVTVQAGAQLKIAGQGHLWLPANSRFEPQALTGSGALRVSVLSGPMTGSGTGLLTSQPGSGVARVTDVYTHESVDVPVDVLAPISPPAPRDGERSVGGVLRALGDVNGDGYDDAAFAFTEPSVRAYYGGLVAVYAGGPSGLDPTPAQVFSGDTDQETLGRDVTSGDVNGDGWTDLVIGADKTDRGGTNNGSVRVHYGTPGGWFSAAPDRALYGDNSYDRLGSAVALCDFDADGYLDLAAGAVDETNLVTASPAAEQGAIHVFRGGPSGFADRADFVIYGVLPDGAGGWRDQPGMHLGTTLAAADLDGDGLCDLVAGAPDVAPDGLSGDGVVAVFRGTVTDHLGLERTPSALFAGTPGTESAFGRRVSLGDVDDDGRADLAVGAWSEQVSAPNGGAVFVFRGGPLSGTTWAQDADWSVYGLDEDGYLGADLDLADLDGDARDELVVSAYRQDGVALEEGEVRVYDGLAARLDHHDATVDTPAARFVGAGEQARLGQAVAVAGDTNGDGRPDLVAFAGNDDTFGVQVGAPIALDGVTGDAARLDLPGEPAGHQIGEGLTLFDVNADGRRDLLVGAPGAGVEGIGANAGTVSAFLATPSGFASTATPILGGHPTHSGSDLFGWDLSTAGDFDGDGYEDLAVVARKDSRPSTYPSSTYSNPEACRGSASQAGAVFVYRGGPSGLSSAPSFATFGVGDSEYVFQARGGFDHNGDGFDDLVIGGPTWDASAGGFAVVYGRPATAKLTVICRRDEYVGAGTFDLLGESVTALGDVDQDGCDELAVGAPGEQFSGDWFDQGVVRVLWGWGGPGCRRDREVTTLAIKEVSAQAGTALAGGGDVDGDGVPDLVVGAAGHRRAFAEVGAAWLVPGWHLLDQPTWTATDHALPQLDETEFSILLPDTALLENLGIIGTVSGGLLGDSLAVVPDPLDPTRAAVAVGVPQGDLGGTLREGGVGLWRYEDGDEHHLPGFPDSPWGLVGGETAVVDGEVGATLYGAPTGAPAWLLVGAPYSDAAGGVDLGAVYAAPLPR